MMFWCFIVLMFCCFCFIAYHIKRISELKYKLTNAQDNLENILSEKKIIESERDDFKNKFNRSEAKLEEVRITRDEYDKMKKENAEHIIQRLSEKVGNISGEQLLRNNEESSKKLKEILLPVDELRKEFQQEMEDFKKNRAVSEEIAKERQDSLQSIVTGMSKIANDFTRACRGDSRAAGEFGEYVLEMCLENSGLQKNEHYSMQNDLIYDSGNRARPDVIVNLPEKRHLIIDAKASLIDYEQLINAELNSDEEKKLLDSFIRSIKRHILSLKERCYTKASNIKSPDFVIMFLPMESALQIVMRNKLWFDAQREGIIIVSPSTLSFVLNIVNSLWNAEKRNANVELIMKIVESMHDKFLGICDGWNKLGNGLRFLVKDYNTVTSRLTGVGGLHSKMLAIEKKSGVVWGNKSLNNRDPKLSDVDVDNSSLYKVINNTEDVD